MKGLKKRFQKNFKKFLTDEEGQGTVEYILLLSLVAFGAIQAGRSFISALDRGVLRLGSELEKDLKTGRAPLNVWKN